MINKNIPLISCFLCCVVNIYLFIQHIILLNHVDHKKTVTLTATLPKNTENAFQTAVKFVLENEGGYSNHAADKGGATAYGINVVNNPDIDADTLTKEEAIEIYKKRYWDGTQIPFIKDPNLQIKFFDAAVHMGYEQATKLLQRAINCTGTESIVDGIFGKKTLANVNNCQNPFGLQYAFIAYMANFYEMLVQKDPSQHVFLVGWLNRALDVVGD